MSKPAGRPSEAWIAMDADHEKVGYVMGYCQDASASCFHTGVCTFEGDCFHTDRSAARAAARAILTAAGGQPRKVADIMMRAAEDVMRDLP